MLPTEEPRPLAEGKRTVYAYRLLIETSTGSIPNAAAKARMKDPVNDFYQGAGLVFLGTRSDLDRDLYTVEWGPCDFPAAAVTDESFTITTRVTNRSAEVWPASGPTRVNLSYRWLDAEGWWWRMGGVPVCRAMCRPAARSRSSSRSPLRRHPAATVW